MNMSDRIKELEEISAAMLEALELLRDARIPEEYAEAIDKANAAIAKAKGEA